MNSALDYSKNRKSGGGRKKYWIPAKRYRGPRASFQMDSLYISIPGEGELAMAVAQAISANLTRKLKRGTTARGKRRPIKDSTIARRLRRPGSKGGNRPFNDTGKLVNFTVTRAGSKGAVVRTGRDAEVVTSLEKRRRHPLHISKVVVTNVLKGFFKDCIQ